MRLKWIGDGSESVPGYPMQDFSCDDSAVANQLIATGLYVAADAANGGDPHKHTASPLRSLHVPHSAANDE